jgi:hypothetical protein
VNEEVPFPEVGEQRLSQVRVNRDAENGHEAEHHVRRDGPVDDPGQPRGVNPLQPGHQRGLTALDVRAAQQQQGERRCHGERHHHRGRHRERVGQRQRPEERPGEPREQEDGDRRRHEDERGVDDRTAYLEAGAEDHRGG